MRERLVKLMTLKRLNLVAALVLAASLALFLAPAGGVKDGDDFDGNRARLLSYMLRDQLSKEHFSRKAFDDDLSRAAFDLYLKQLDGQKRFLLQTDVDRLRRFETRIDDEMRLGAIELPDLSREILQERVPQVRTLVRDLLAGEFDFDRAEEFETDPDKLGFCVNLGSLRERWRQLLKFQVMSRYLNLLEDQEEQTDPTQVNAARRADLRREARQKVLKSYEDLFERMLETKPQERFDQYFNAVTRAFDPHTNYLPPATKEDFDISMRGSLEGIGATLREEDGYIKVVQIIPGSAAARQGQLQAEDVILMVAQGGEEPVDVTDTRLRDAVALIRGPKGTEVRLTVKKTDGRRQVIPIVRDIVQIEETFVKSATLQDASGQTRYGYIKIPSFYRDFKQTRNGGQGRNSTDDMRAALKELGAQQISGLILDLRNNGGGALTDAVSIAGLFLDQGPVVQVKSSSGRAQVLRDRDRGVAYDGPLVVLVNQFSASASEILAGALQDYRRAVILGSAHTHGKGTVQTLVDLDRNLVFKGMDKYRPLGALKVTTQKFYRVSGDSTQSRGVEPDVVLPGHMDYLESGEKYADHALPWDQVAGVPHRSWDLPAGRLEAASSASRQRVASSEAFAGITRTAQRAKQQSEQTRQSLRLADLLKEREETRKFREENGDQPENHPATGEDGPPDADSWRAELKDDPYVQEALLVLADLRAR